MSDGAPDAQRVVDLHKRILRDAKIRLAPDAAILDFGCASGRHVYEYLDCGYRGICGYDISEVVELRRPGDIERFRFAANGQFDRIPFPDDTFDFIYSVNVFEHVRQPEPAWREIRRALKPDGVSLHILPSKWRPIEPHLLVPLGGAISAAAWYRLWAALGIRNRSQRGQAAAVVARANSWEIANGLHYLGGGELDRMLRGIFREVAWVELSFLRHSPGRSRHLFPLCRTLPALVWVFRFLHTRVVLLRK